MDSDIDQVTQRTVDAASAPPAASPNAISSPFAMAKQYRSDASSDEEGSPPATPPAAEKKPSLVDRAVQVIAACGPLTPASGFKAWLGKRGEPSAEAPRKSLGKAHSRPAKARSPSRRTHAPQPAAAPSAGSFASGFLPARKPAAAAAPAGDGASFACGLFNTGELVIRDGEQELRLSVDKTRTLVAYLVLTYPTWEEAGIAEARSMREEG